MSESLLVVHRPPPVPTMKAGEAWVASPPPIVRRPETRTDLDQGVSCALLCSGWVLRFCSCYLILTVRAHLDGMCFYIMSLGRSSISRKIFPAYTRMYIYRTRRSIVRAHVSCRWQARMLEIPGVKLGLQQQAVAQAAGL